ATRLYECRLAQSATAISANTYDQPGVSRNPQLRLSARDRLSLRPRRSTGTRKDPQQAGDRAGDARGQLRMLRPKLWGDSFGAIGSTLPKSSASREQWCPEH